MPPREDESTLGDCRTAARFSVADLQALSYALSCSGVVLPRTEKRVADAKELAQQSTITHNA